MQHFLKAASGAAWAKIVAAQFFEKLFSAVDDAMTAFDVGFGRESFAALTAALERRRIHRDFRFA